MTSPLSDLSTAVTAAGLTAPSLIIVGECVTERESIAWFERRPLLGRSIGITRPATQAAGAIQRLVPLGAEPVLMPTIEILPPEANGEVDDVLDRLETFHWIVFTSVNGVAGLLGRLWDRGGDLRCLGGIRLAAIGPATAEALAEYRLRVDLVPESYRAEALGAALAGQVAGQRVLWARANRGRDVLPTLLAEGGAEVEELVVYRNLDVEAWPAGVVERLRAGAIDWVGLSSPSIARNVARLADSSGIPLATTRLASISPVTTAAAREAGLTVAAEAIDFTWDGILEAIIAADG